MTDYPLSSICDHRIYKPVGFLSRVFLDFFSELENIEADGTLTALVDCGGPNFYEYRKEISFVI